jgi:glutathione S-transferase
MNLTLYAESGWISPWVFHAMVALEEKQLPYRLEVVPLPVPAATRELFVERALLGKVPVLVHDELWLSESLAISEYLAETFPTPGHPRIFPADLADRARSRQVMSFLRTDLGPLRAERPTTSIFGAPVTAPLSAEAAGCAAELVRLASRLVADGATAMFGAFCIADADLALALMRLVKNGDPVPPTLVAYAEAVWARPSVQRFGPR